MAETDKVFYTHLDWNKIDFNDPKSYNAEPLPTLVLTKEDILERYWTYWVGEMEKKYGPGHELTTPENCLDDYIMSNHAMAVNEVVADAIRKATEIENE
jgi:hypothetical protein